VNQRESGEHKEEALASKSSTQEGGVGTGNCNTELSGRKRLAEVIAIKTMTDPGIKAEGR